MAINMLRFRRLIEDHFKTADCLKILSVKHLINLTHEKENTFKSSQLIIVFLLFTFPNAIREFYNSQ